MPTPEWIMDFVRKYSKYPERMRRVDDELMACCPMPWHPEKRPSFGINLKTGQWNCFGCGAKGPDIESLVKKILKISLEEAKSFTGSDRAISAEKILADIRAIENQRNVEEVFLSHCELPKRAPDQTPIYDYFKSRGYDVAATQRIMEFYGAYLCDSGTYRGRIICPIFDVNRNPVYFTNRAIDEHPKKTLYPTRAEARLGRHFLGEQWMYDNPILVEGMFDVFKLFTFGLQPISCLGCHVSDNQIVHITSRYKEITLCLDTDAAGLKGMRDFIKRAYDIIKIMVVILPIGKDPDDCSWQEFKTACADRFTLDYEDVLHL